MIVFIETIITQREAGAQGGVTRTDERTQRTIDISPVIYGREPTLFVSDSLFAEVISSSCDKK